MERQHIAQKEKEYVQELKEKGAHRNVKKRTKRPRVTIPKKRQNRKYIREAMDVIQSASGSTLSHSKVTPQELVMKGFTQRDVIEAADDIEDGKIEQIKSQFYDRSGIEIDSQAPYKSALDTLHKYLHSFDI